MTSSYEHPSLLGQDLYDADGEKVGRVQHLYTGTGGGQPQWAAVSTGLLGTRVSLVPLQGVTSTGDGFRVRCTRDQVKGAPHLEPDGRLSDQEEAELHRHYGTSAPAPSGHRPGDATQDAVTPPEVTRYEEEVVTNTEVTPQERVRLEKEPGKETVAEQEPVGAALTTERIAVDRDG